MKFITGLLLYCLFILLITSCASSEKARQQLVYFKNIKDSSFAVAQAYDPVLQKGDILGLTVSGSILKKEASEAILQSINRVKSSSGTENVSADGYLIDADGNITIPFLGNIRAEGLTKKELAAIIKEKLTKEIVDPIVEIKQLNFKITILGEVGKPGTVRVNNDKITILEAIGEAGDLKVTGKRENILIIRDNNGEKQIGRINLNDGNIFSSPYYFLKQNDVVYVELNGQTLPEANLRVLQYIQLGLAVVTSISLLINIFK
ncbi:MAG TPA: polysaccharide biosynthesis/export family protein [Chitinophagaceae bacterium]|nr:polysaccharide biosynthesis/export family protein [Chitinophagaceae bacterium]